MRRFWVLILFTAVLVGLVPPAMAQDLGWIPDPPVETNVDLPPGLIPYHEIAGRLRDIDARSDRVSVEILGQSAGGRDLYLVTVADQNAGNLQADLGFRQLMTDFPRAARLLAQRNPRLRSVLWVNGSIHGDEWEGVDASLALIERLAFASDPETLAVLRENIVLFNVVQNPDGRVQGTRSNANGFDLNRDFATLSQPETRAVVEQFVKWHPTALDDLHGYVDPMLIEPTTAPHNPNYEYDLYIKHAYPRGKVMEANLLAETGLPAQIPFEDRPRGDWDDWPPIFTPQQAQYHGAIASTLESPTEPDVDLPPEERARLAQVNLSAHVAAVWVGWRYLTENAQAVMLDQIEIFRRGVDAEPPVSMPFLELGPSLGYPSPEEAYDAHPPAAYVIPAGSGQRSEVAAARLVNLLRFSGVRVRRAALPLRAEGVVYPGGSYIVDMGQALRGLANSYLEPGYDLTPVTPQMYDISGWSHGELWGATVVPVEDDLSRRGLPLLGDVQARTNLRPGAAGYAIDVTDPAAVRAVNLLLDLGVPVVRLPDGRVAVPAAAYADLEKAVDVEGVRVTALDALPAGEALERVRVAAAATPEEVFALREIGYEVTPVTAATLAGTLSPGAHDVLFVSSGLDWDSLSPEAQGAVQAFLAAGGGLVTRGATGANFNIGAAVLDAGVTTAPPGTATPNGVGRVTHPGGSAITGGYPPEDTTFVESPVWFTTLGTGITVDERFATGDFFFAGHWIGQEAAAGQPSVVSGVDETGARAVLFGTHPLFRAHPKKLYGQVAQALYWASVTHPRHP